MSTVTEPGAGSARTDAHSNYRAFLRTSADPTWLDRAVDQIGAWLRNKDVRLDVNLRVDGTYGIAGKFISVRRHRNGGEDGLRFTMTEGEEGNQYVTTVMLVAGRTAGWMSLNVINQGGAWVAPPRLAKNLLIEPGSFTDGGYVVSDKVWHVRTARERAALLDLLVSDRSGPVFVAAAGPQDQELSNAFAQKVDEWTSGASGLAHRVFLDAESADWLRIQVDGTLSVSEWTVRTFRPGINLAAPPTLRLHRTMGMKALTETSEPRLRRLFSVFARQLLDEQPEQAEVGHWRRTFERLDSRDAAEGLRRVARRADFIRRRTDKSRGLESAQILSASIAPADDSTYDAQETDVTRLLAQLTALARERDQLVDTLDRIQGTLLLPDLSEESLLELVEAATASEGDQDAASTGAARIDELEEQVADLELKVRTQHESEWAAREDAVDALQQVSDLDRTVHQLARQLAAARSGTDAALNDADSLYAPAVAPGSWQDLVERFGEWEPYGVLITADTEIAADLHEIDSDGRCLSNAWRALTALSGYLRAKQDGVHQGGFMRYLDAQPAGYPHYNQAWFATSESKDAMKGAWGRERDFPVPASISEEEVIEMQQHIRIGRIPNLNPRIYIHDDSNNSRTIVVGYIGPHLTTSATARLNR